MQLPLNISDFSDVAQPTYGNLRGQKERKKERKKEGRKERKKERKKKRKKEREKARGNVFFCFYIHIFIF